MRISPATRTAGSCASTTRAPAARPVPGRRYGAAQADRGGAGLDGHGRARRPRAPGGDAPLERLPLRAVEHGRSHDDRGRDRSRARASACPGARDGGSMLRVFGPAESGVTGGRYRDVIVLHRAGDHVPIVDDVGLERYLYGVVLAEMPAAWPGEALRSQAVVARSYALTSRRPSEPFDVYADTRSQADRGVAGETAHTTEAVRATSGIVLMFGTNIARTLSFLLGRSHRRGRGGLRRPPMPYLRSVADPYDRLSPHHDWTATLTDEEAERDSPQSWPATSSTSRSPPGPRADARRPCAVIGTLGNRDVPGTTARTLLHLRSAWFSVIRNPRRPAPGQRHGRGGRWIPLPPPPLLRPPPLLPPPSPPPPPPDRRRDPSRLPQVGKSRSRNARGDRS